MAKNTLVENEWTLWSYRVYPDFPSTWYFWINPDGVIKYCRSVEPLGYWPTGLDIDLWIDKKVNPQTMKKLGCKKINAKMSQEYLSRGILHL
jgi:hypothetical protein